MTNLQAVLKRHSKWRHRTAVHGVHGVERYCLYGLGQNFRASFSSVALNDTRLCKLEIMTEECRITPLAPASGSLITCGDTWLAWDVPPSCWQVRLRRYIRRLSRRLRNNLKKIPKGLPSNGFRRIRNYHAEDPHRRSPRRNTRTSFKRSLSVSQLPKWRKSLAQSRGLLAHFHEHRWHRFNLRCLPGVLSDR